MIWFIAKKKPQRIQNYSRFAISIVYLLFEQFITIGFQQQQKYSFKLNKPNFQKLVKVRMILIKVNIQLKKKSLCITLL